MLHIGFHDAGLSKGGRTSCKWSGPEESAQSRCSTKEYLVVLCLAFLTDELNAFLLLKDEQPKQGW